MDEEGFGRPSWCLGPGPILPSASFLDDAVELTRCAENSGMTGDSAPSQSNFDKLTLRQRGGLARASTGHAGGSRGRVLHSTATVNMTLCRRHNVRHGAGPRLVLSDRKKKKEKKHEGDDGAWGPPNELQRAGRSEAASEASDTSVVKETATFASSAWSCQSATEIREPVRNL